MSQQISDEQVRHVARLSRLLLSEDEVAQFGHQLSAVLDYVARLNELDVEGVEPMAHAADLTNVLRDDVPQSGLDVDTALANAPARSTPVFKVPKGLGDSSGA